MLDESIIQSLSSFVMDVNKTHRMLSNIILLFTTRRTRDNGLLPSVAFDRCKVHYDSTILTSLNDLDMLGSVQPD